MGSAAAELATIPVLAAALGSETQRTGLLCAASGAAITKEIKTPCRMTSQRLWGAMEAYRGRRQGRLRPSDSCHQREYAAVVTSVPELGRLLDSEMPSRTHASQQTSPQR